MAADAEPVRLLVVEDDDTVAELLTDLCLDAGYAPRRVANGERALAVVGQDPPPALVLLDVMLPGMDGYEVCRRIKAMESARGWLPVLMLTALAQRADNVRGLDIGADDYLVKPFDNDVLLAKIRALLRIRSAEQALRQRNRALAAVNHVAATVTRSLDLDHTLDIGLAEVIDLAGARTGVVFLCKPETGAFQLAAQRGLSAALDAPLARVELRLDNLRNLTYTELTPLAPVLRQAGLDALIEPVNAVGVTDFLALPLTTRNQVHGLLALGYEPDHALPAFDIELLESLAQWLAVAIDNGRLYRDALTTRAYLEAFYRNSLNLMLTLRRDGCYSFGGERQLREQFGYRPEEMAQQPFSAFFPESARPLWEQHWQRALAGESDSFATEFCHADGSLANVQVSYSPLHEYDEILVEVMDITERVRLQEHIAQSERLKALGEMASGVAHDFNNVLAGILGQAELLDRDVEFLEEHEIRQRLRIIQQAALDGAQMVRRIQEFTRIRRETDFVAVDPSQVMHDALEMARFRWRDLADADGRPIAVRQAWQAEQWVVGNLSELREAILNLIINAIDAMPQGGTLSCETFDRDDLVCLSVVDTGMGMAEHVRRRVFDPFFSTKGESGNGLGLSVTYGVITRHNGTIEVESREGQGSRFTLCLPAIAPDRSAPPEEAAPAEARPARILAVDDEPVLLGVLSQLLEADGHQVIVCDSGREALELIKRETFDLILTDLGMPEVNGWVVAAAAKARSPQPVVGLITGWGTEIGPDDVHRHAVDLLIAKPYHLAEVRNQVREALNARARGLRPEA